MNGSRPPSAPSLDGRVVLVAGAGGGAGPAVAHALTAAGAAVSLCDRDASLVDPLIGDLQAAGASARGAVVDLLDEAAVRDWVAESARDGQVDGLVHLVGGWRGSPSFGESDLRDWEALHGPLIRSVQHTSLAVVDALAASSAGRYVLISSREASRPAHTNAAYAAAKAAAEVWTLAMADSLRDTSAAATIIVVKALLTPAAKAAASDPQSLAGHTDVYELGEVITRLWSRSPADLNGRRLWLTPRPPTEDLFDL